MPRKPPDIERKLILARDQRRKYGSRLTIQVLRPEDIGGLENVTLLLANGSLATIRPEHVAHWEGGKQYAIDIEGFPTASEAEVAGMQVAQALLLCAVSLNFGLRLSYHSHEPPTVFDRTVSLGLRIHATLLQSWPSDVVVNEIAKAIDAPLKDRKLLLSMELFVAAALESNDRARFVMAVSALEPLASQQSMGPDVIKAVDALCDQLDADTSVSTEHRKTVRERLVQLKRESVRQSLKRLCARWFPSDALAWSHIDRAYGLRSELLHEGRLSDRDVLLNEETDVISRYLRRIYQYEYGFSLRGAI